MDDKMDVVDDGAEGTENAAHEVDLDNEDDEDNIAGGCYGEEGDDGGGDDDWGPEDGEFNVDDNGYDAL